LYINYYGNRIFEFFFILRESFNRFIEKSLKGVLIDEKRDEKPFYKDRGKEDRKNNFYSRRRKRV
jgi:ATP-dependent RNA helicase SUPV3L1/SUV3